MRINEPRFNDHGLGDRIEQALTILGITKERISKWVGKPCGCPERKEKLNRLGRWATRILRGSLENADKYLNEILEERE